MSLAVFQREAERVAERLGVTVPIRLAWKRDCPRPGRWGAQTYAHCHLNGNARGVICLRERYWYGAKLKDVRWMIRHEVAHLVVRGHRAKGFAEAMALGAGKKPHQHRFREIRVDVLRSPLPEIITVRSKCRCGRVSIERHEVVNLKAIGTKTRILG